MLPRSDRKVCREEEEEEEEAPLWSREHGALRHNGAPWRQMVELREAIVEAVGRRTISMDRDEVSVETEDLD